MACHQFALLDRVDVLRVAEPGAVFLLDSSYGPGEVWDRLPRRVQQQIVSRNLRLFVIDGQRVARATGTILMRPATFALIAHGAAPKGDVLAVARVAAIQAAKRTADLVPLCHPLPITRVNVDFELDDHDAAAPCVRCTAQVETLARTGVEMEALTTRISSNRRRKSSGPSGLA